MDWDCEAELYKPMRLERWKLPEYYVGADWPEWYVGLGQARDSDSLTRSNFICFLEALGGESLTVRVIRERHWAVGWVEWIGIHDSATEALKIADSIMKDLDGYPVVNEDHWAQLEWDEAHEYWERMSLRERVEWCRDCGVSIFAARRGNDLPDVICERLREI